MKVIVGLGNPGIEYENTRHNTGFMVIDNYLSKYENVVYKQKFGGLYYKCTINNENVLFIKPQEYINLSGVVIRKFKDYYKFALEDILIINDDMDLKLGTFKLKLKGSSAGHNGLKNITECLNSDEFKRLKIGISSNNNMDKKDYVLGKFNNEELDILNSILPITKDIIDDYINIPFEKIMSKYNKKQEL